MGVGNQGGGGNSGNKRSNHNFEHRQLLALGELVVSSSTAGLATEGTLISVLNAIVSSDQDIEILLVRDTGNGDEVVQQITNYETGVPVVIYKDVNGAPYIPVGPLEYLDPSAVLNLILTEITAINAGGQLLTEATFVAEDFATETTLQALETLIISTNALLTTIDADTSNLDVLSSTRASELTLQATNTLLTTIDGILDAIKIDTGALVVDLAAIEVLITSANALLTIMASDLAGINTEIQLTNIELSNIKVDTGNIATDTSTLATPVTGLAAVNLRVTGAGAASVVAGKRRVSFFNAGDVDTTVAGATLKAGEITTFVAGERDVLAAIAYDALASELLISTIG